MLHRDDICKNFSVNYVKFDDAEKEILDNRNFSILYMNINSIVSEKKRTEFDIFLQDFDNAVDVIVLTETFLKPIQNVCYQWL